MAVFCHAADNHHVHWEVCDGSSDLTASTQTSTRSRSCAATEAPELWEKFHTEVTEFDEVLFLESCDSRSARGKLEKNMQQKKKTRRRAGGHDL